MSPSQLKVLDFIASYTAAHRIAPTLEEIKDHLGLVSKSGAHRIVIALIEQGRLARTRDGSRNLVVVEDGSKLHGDLSQVPTTALRAELQRRGENVHG